MKYLFITEISLLSPLLDFDINGINIDLHNDFECVTIKKVEKNLEVHFKRLIGNEFYKEQNAVVIFSDIIECNIDLLEKKGEIGVLSALDNFAKGDLTEANQFFHDKSIKYFFMGFISGSLINIFCKEAIIFLW